MSRIPTHTLDSAWPARQRSTEALWTTRPGNRLAMPAGVKKSSMRRYRARKLERRLEQRCFADSSRGHVAHRTPDRSGSGSIRAFYERVLGAEVLRERDPVILQFHNTRIIANIGGPPTDDKPRVTVAPPVEPDLASFALNIRVSTPTLSTSSSVRGERSF